MPTRYSRILALLVALLWTLGLFIPSAFGRDEWFDDYEAGLAALQAGKTEEAIAALQRAIAEKKEPGYHRTYGMNHIRYIPYFHLAEAYRAGGECEEALRLLERSRALSELSQLANEARRRAEIEEQCRKEMRDASDALLGEPEIPAERQEASDIATAQASSHLSDMTRRGIEDGVSAYLGGRYQEAVDILERVLLEDDLPRVRVLLGSALYQVWTLSGGTDSALSERIESELRSAAAQDSTLELDSRVHPAAIRKLYQGFSTENLTE